MNIYNLAVGGFIYQQYQLPNSIIPNKNLHARRKNGKSMKKVAREERKGGS